MMRRFVRGVSGSRVAYSSNFGPGFLLCLIGSLLSWVAGAMVASLHYPGAEALDAVRDPSCLATRPPTPLVAKAGEELRAAVRLSMDSAVLQFGVRRA